MAKKEQKMTVGIMELSQSEDNRVEQEGLFQPEDAALKTMMQFFAEEILPFFHIEGKVTGFAPTELVRMELEKLYEDFNLVMEDGSWKHFEFQSTNEGLIGLKRFRTYEAASSYHHKVPVTTYVLFSGQIKNPMTEFSEGINTYRVVPIVMRDWDAKEELKKIEEKAEAGEILSRKDLIPVALAPLMGGDMEQKERFKSAYAITREVKTENPDDIRKIEAVIYTMAEKFLSKMSMQEVLEDMKMTRLGKMLTEEGKREGRIEGQIEGRREGELLNLISQIQKKCQKGKTIENIADELEESVEDIKNIYEMVSENPEQSRDAILEMLKNNK